MTCLCIFMNRMCVLDDIEWQSSKTLAGPETSIAIGKNNQVNWGHKIHPFWKGIR